MRKKDIFYKYDLYAIERIYPECEFVQLLEKISSLNASITPFINEVTDLLYSSIKDDKDVKIEKIKLPNIDKKLEKNLANNSLYTSYKSHSQKSLSEFVFHKFLKRLFQKDGLNDETHVIQDYIHSWLEKKLALSIVKDIRFSSLDVLTSLLNKTEMLQGLFYVEFIENIPTEWVINNEEKWIDVNVSPDKLLDTLRTPNKEYLDEYIDYTKNPSKENLWNFVQEATRYSDYIMMNDEFSFISSVLINKDVSLWIKLWDNLKLPIIQDCVFTSSIYFSPQKYIELASKLTDEKTVVNSDLKVLLFIIACNYFETSYKLTERFSIYDDSERKNVNNEIIFNEGLEQQKKWLKEKKGNYKNIFQFLEKKLSNSEIEDWIFSYKPKTNSHQHKPNNIYNSEIKLLIEIYKEKLTESLSLNIQSFNLQKFNFYVDVIKEKNDKIITSDLLKGITNYISTEEFFWDMTYAEPYWSALKGLGFILSRQENPILTAKKLINRFKVNHQGWNPSKIDNKTLTKEVFIYSSIALLFENESAFKDETEKEAFFKKLLNHILTQDRFSIIDYSQYYQIPLHLLFLVASQIFPEVKEFYEQELIDNYDNLFSLLAILSSNDVALSNKSKEQLIKRLNIEFLLLKRQFNNRRQKDKVQELEKKIETLKLEEKNCR